MSGGLKPGLTSFAFINTFENHTLSKKDNIRKSIYYISENHQNERIFITTKQLEVTRLYAQRKSNLSNQQAMLLRTFSGEISKIVQQKLEVQRCLKEETKSLEKTKSLVLNRFPVTQGVSTCYNLKKCGKSSMLPSKFSTQKHTGENLYKCSVCEFVSSQKRIFKHHMRKHTGEKPHKCTECEYSSSYFCDLKTHMRKHTGEKPYKCTKCEYASSYFCDLKTHMRKHNGEKPYKCTKCTYASSYSCDLTRHLRTHSGEKPYKCTECEYACSQNGSIKRHMQTHSGEKLV